MNPLSDITPISPDAATVITPALAKHLLEHHNPRNRMIRASRVRRLADDMAAGRFAINGATIVLDADYNVLDGQHRLTAIVESEVAVPIMVVVGVEPDAQKAMDITLSRRGSDALGLDGHPDRTIASATTGLVLHWRDGNILNTRSGLPAHSPARIAAEYPTDPTIKIAVEIGAKARSRTVALPTPTATAFFAWLAMNAGATRQQVEAYVADLKEMRTSGSGDPRMALLSRLQSARNGRETLRTVTHAAILAFAWNAIQTGAWLQKVQTDSGGKPRAFPAVLPPRSDAAVVAE